MTQAGQITVRLPVEPADPWFTLRYPDRALGADLWRVFGDGESIDATLDSLPDVVCRKLSVDGRDRPTVRRAVVRLIEAGLILWDGTFCRLLYSQRAYRAAQLGMLKDSDERTSRAYVPRKRVFERDGWRCAYCQCELDPFAAHIDHVIPLSRGGSSDDENLVAACQSCNLSKGAKTPEEWLQ